MSLKIVNWIKRDESIGCANVTLNGNSMEVLIKYNGTNTLPLNTELATEFDFDELLDCRLLTDKTDTDAVILQNQDGYEIIGKIVNIIAIDSEECVIDLYIQQGPEFMAFTAPSEKFKVNDFIFLRVTGLCCYPC